MRQHELEADQERGGQRGELERRLAAAARTPSATAPTTSSTCEHALDDVQVGQARAWYCRQSQIENGDSRPIW